MNNRWAGLVVLFALLAVPAARGQSAKTRIEPGVLPAAPLVRPIPDGSAWSLEVTSLYESQQAKEKESGESGKPAVERKAGFEAKEVKGALSSGVCRAAIRYANGAVRSFYRKGKYELFMNPKTGRAQASPIESNNREDGVCNAAGKLREFSWVAGKYYLGSSLYDGRSCHVYRRYARRGEAGVETDEGALVRPLYSFTEARRFSKEAQIFETAYIDQATGLPAALEDGSGIRIYRFRMEKEPFAVPPELLKALEEAVAGESRLQQKYRIAQ